jgi:hypothetical protein
MERIAAYQTADGKIFADAQDAIKHDKYLAMMPEIELFMNSSYCQYNNQAHRKIVENTILAWKDWCDK